LTCKHPAGAGDCACSICDVARAEYLFCCIHQYQITVQEICFYLSAWKFDWLETKEWSIAVCNKDSWSCMACWDFGHMANTSRYHSKVSSIALFASYTPTECFSGLQFIILNKRICLSWSASFACLHSGGMYKSWALGHHGGWIFGGGSWYFWVLRVELAACHPSGIQNFLVIHRFLEDSFTSDMQTWICFVEHGLTMHWICLNAAHILLYVDLQHIVCVQIFSLFTLLFPSV
jgi:hypothetical protein